MSVIELIQRVGLVLACLFMGAAVIMSIIGLIKSAKAKNGDAVEHIIYMMGLVFPGIALAAIIITMYYLGHSV